MGKSPLHNTRDGNLWVANHAMDGLIGGLFVCFKRERDGGLGELQMYRSIEGRMEEKNRNCIGN